MVNRRIHASAEILSAPPHAEAGQEIVVTTHESVYRLLRERIFFGGFLPGGAVTLRGLAEELGVSPMPVREAVRRLIAERALTMQDNRRVLVPAMTREKFEQILFAREALEPELAARALPRLTSAGIDAITQIDRRIDESMLNGDVDGYMRGNFRFHFTLYDHAGADTLQALVESIWLQFGPFMRMAYGRIGTSKLEDYHHAALDAMRRADASALRRALAADIRQGMGFIGDVALGVIQ